MPDKENWLSHGFKRAPSLFEAQSALGWGVVVTVLALLGVIYLTQGSQAIVSSYHIQVRTWDLRILQQENAKLDAQIATAQSVGTLRNRAIELGLLPAGPDDIEYLTVNNYPPVPGQVMIAQPATPPQPAGGLAGWWQSLTRGFRGWTKATAGTGGQ